MNRAFRIARLEREHAEIEEEIAEASTHPSVRRDGLLLQGLKRKKLSIKDEIEKFKRSMVAV